MPRLSSYERRAVVSTSGRRLGHVEAVLFHPSQPRVVGVQIGRTAILGVIDRRAHFALLGQLVAQESDEFRFAAERLPKDRDGEAVLGNSWQDTVVWHGMPVCSPEGEPVGAVHDAIFSAEDGLVNRLVVSTGVFGDVALGRLEVPGEFVSGFDGKAVRMLPGYGTPRAEGGAAKAMAAGTAVLRVRAGQVADGALQVGVAAAGALGRSLKRGAGRKAMDKIKSLMGDDG